MTDFYSILGITRDASEDDIKRAWRKKSSEMHPDRDGGDGDAQANLNVAYECLSDPEKRKHYNQTGAAPKELDSATKDILYMSFMELIKRGISFDRLKFVEDIIRANMAEQQERRRGHEAERAKLQRMRDKVRTRNPETMNVYQLIIDKEIEAHVEEISRADRFLKAAQQALDSINNDYEAEGALTAPQTHSQVSHWRW